LLKIPYQAHFRSAVSDSRLAGFRRAPTDTEDQIVGRYLWNVVLSEAILTPLHFLEIALRNSFNDYFARRFGNLWFVDRQVLFPQDRGTVFDVQLDLEEEGKDPDDSGRVIAGLMLGFWLRLLDKRYAKNGQRRLWDTALDQIFPYLNPPGKPSRGIGFVRSRLYSVRLLRNRVAHHEPIWQGIKRDIGGVPTLVPLSDVNDELVEAIAWIRPALAHASTGMSRVKDVLAKPEADYAALAAGLAASWVDP
jgi:hypothetical protein